MQQKQDNEKREFTERFLTALDYLIDSNKLGNVVDFEQKTGIRKQKITGMRAFLKGESKTGLYPGLSDIKIMNELFKVSLDYIFNGLKPIILEPEPSMVSDMERPEYSPRPILELREEIRMLKDRMNILAEKVDFYKEIATRKLS